MNFRKPTFYTLIIILGLGISSCGGDSSSSKTSGEKPKSMINSPAKKASSGGIENPLEMKGIGPITSVTLGEIDQSMVEAGKKIYEEKCTACHKLDTKFIGPPPKGILERRSPEWIMNMILNPEVMIKEDPLAKKVLVESNMAVMANQNLTEEEARNVLEYFRTL